ncbi:DUF5959 family protein [Streptomyces sp. NPDC051940]|uniref:DUF5959 family protein n=1 Tax=Streptomyces sp. NPDC051940 TaxID=3155675 RepID=UPI00341A329F
MDRNGIDLIRLAGTEGNSVVVRVLGRDTPGVLTGHDTLRAEIVLGSDFVTGSLATWLLPEDVTEWEAALQALSAGRDVSWPEGGRGPELRIDLEDEFSRASVTVADRSMSLTSVTVTIGLTDGWLEEHYAKLQLVRAAWPREVIESAPGVYEWEPTAERHPPRASDD